MKTLYNAEAVSLTCIRTQARTISRKQSREKNKFTNDENLQLLFLLITCIVLVFFAVVLLFLLVLFGFLLAFWHFYLLDGRIWVHAELLRHEPVHTVHERRRVRDLVTGLKQSRLEGNLGSVQSRLVILVRLDLAPC